LSTSTSLSAACTSGSVRPGVSGNFGGLCDYNCAFNNCVTDACQCDATAATGKTAPALTGQRGCPADGLSKEDNSWYVTLCAFVCARGYCPPAACRYC
jgi:hypothetical protein